MKRIIEKQSGELKVKDGIIGEQSGELKENSRLIEQQRLDI